MIFGLRSIRYATRSFLKNLWRIITRKPIMVPICVAHQRLNVCRKCEHLVGEQCGVCTCFIELKVQFYSESCPDSPPRWK